MLFFLYRKIERYKLLVNIKKEKRNVSRFYIATEGTLTAAEGLQHA